MPAMKTTGIFLMVAFASMTAMAERKDGDTLDGGKILDPKKGKVYSCEMWRKGENLIVRGKIAFIGRNQTWLPYKDEDLSKEAKPLVPALPRLK